MENTFAHHSSLPAEQTKRIELVVAVCISIGYVNRDLLAKYYGLTQLQASILLREFLQIHVNDVRRDIKQNAYVLLGYPKRCDVPTLHSNTH